MRVEFLTPLASIDAENDNCDVLLHLDDGRVYSFVVATPHNLFWCMDNDERDFFFGVPPVLVKRLTPEIVERALTAIVSEDGGRWLSVYGTLQE